MEEKSLVVVEQPQNVQTESVLFIEQFINDNYRLRRNVLSGKVEFKMREDVTADYRPLTQEAQNSMVIRALREGLDEVCNPKADITMYVNSEEGTGAGRARGRGGGGGRGGKIGGGGGTQPSTM